MPSSFADPPPRSWWPLAKSPSGRDLRQKYAQDKDKPGRRPSAHVKTSFSSFASAIGLKSKKQHPSLAIQDPPSPIDPSPLVSPRPASSTRSRVDSLGPRTPLDFHRDRRQSLLTLSDADPFAGRPIVDVPVPHIPSDPNRLSAYSIPSVSDFAHKRVDVETFNRGSYASSSSNSNNHGADISPFGAFPPSNLTPDTRQLHTKRSAGSLQAMRSDPLSRQTSVNSESKFGSSSTLVDAHHIAAHTRPKMRARGMTDGGTSHKAGFFVEERLALRKLSQKSTSSKVVNSGFPTPPLAATPTSPRVVVRQASFSRLQCPPSAPPTHSLPSPPRSSTEELSSRQRPGLGSRESASSSCISFSSSISLTNDMFANPSYPLQDPDKRSSQRSLFSQNAHDHCPETMYSPTSNESRTAPSSPRTLKKALSHHSLTKRGHTSPSSSTPKSPPPEQPNDKGFRKHRTFHHSRLPIPPIPLSIRTSNSSSSTFFPSTPDSGGPSVMEQRKGSSTSSTGRRRLFSNSSHTRPSTSQCLPISTKEDDTLSVFSLRSDNDHHFASYTPWITANSKPSSSFWDEGASGMMPISPPRSNIDYMPQAILSRAELAKLEASVENSPERTSRARGFSLLSASTMGSEQDMEPNPCPAGLSPPPSARSNTRHVAQRMSSQSANARVPPVVVTSRATSPPPPSVKPISEGHVGKSNQMLSSAASQVSEATMRPRSPSGALFMTSLPPPPHPRQRVRVSSQPKVPVTVAATTVPVVQPLSVRKPGPSSIRSKSSISVEKVMHRRSIMRKPSFLDIDDDTDQDETESEFVQDQMSGSFLDLARESFDTVRSDG